MSRRTEAKKRNRMPYWSARVAQGAEAADAAAAMQWDLARTYINRIPFAGQRDQQWRSLAAGITAYTCLFTGQPATPGVPSDTTGRNADTARTVRAGVLAVDLAAFEFDTARKLIRRVEDPEQQELHWRGLESALHTFNQRFDRDPTRAVARMAINTTRHN